MANYLYKLGDWTYRKRKRVVVGWIAILIVIALAVVSLGMKFNDDMSIPGTPSEEAMNVLNKEFSQSGEKGGQVRLIFKAKDGETLASPSTKRIIESTLKQATKDSAVKEIAIPYQTGTISENKKIGYADITYKVEANKVTENSKEKVKEIAETARDKGLQTELAGSVAFSEIEVGGASEGIGIMIAYGVLAFTFASFLAAGLPIITSIVGLGAGILTVLFTTNFMDVQSVSLSLAVMIGLAVGIDYALFIMSRHRQYLAEGFSIRESIARATATAGSAVVFAGVTVIIALCGLSIVGVPFLTTMGIAAAITVFAVLLIAITLVPAVISIAGNRISPARRNRLFSKWNNGDKQNKEANRWGRFIARFPIQIALVCVVLTGIISYPALHMELGLPDNGMKSEDTTERRGYDLMAEGFGAGVNGPLVVIMDASKSNQANQAFSEGIKELGELKNIATITPPMPNKSGDYALLNITPKTGPNDTKTKDLVHALRDKSDELKKQHNLELMVTGSTAVNIDISEKLTEALPQFAGVIVAFALLLLVLVFRSIIVPLKAVLGFIMTLTATLGFAVFVLQDGHFAGLFGVPEAGPLLNFMPVLVTGILFGLAMDYEVFLVSRIREEFMHTGNARKSVLSGLKHSGPVVTAAGLIMIAVFASFIFSGETTIKSMGLAMAFGVLFDAFVIRMTLIPALMILLKKASWYFPKWLDRIIPNVDVEGESLNTTKVKSRERFSK
ncbi:MMPL family transporter [Priestia endophytica]|uniref:MMPL family transporter n=1 Tax=Priestia endophytica TaxID=135735 RepID=UPI002040E7F2|nr:MMPL family transporter [Priestia endophytica]MCM3540410.1 MMPL family transporter [Priestia endophytica]